jgi:hypothetical protein
MSMSRDTIQQLKDQLNRKSFDPTALAKAITQSTGLVAIDLEAPSKKLYPVLSPFRNECPRFADMKGGTAVQWRGVTSIASGTYQVEVVEGQRNQTFSLGTANFSGSYKGIGVEQSVTFEAD